MADNTRTSTNTQIRNFYSEGLSYINVSFFNTNLSFKFVPFLSKDQNGKNSYDSKNALNTTVNYEGASALSLVAENIINGKIQECNLPIPCAAGANLNLERKLSQSGTMETIFSITKNNVTIPFVFSTMTIQAKVDGKLTQQVIESGLDSFRKTIDGYLTGINADRHLDKLTDDYVKSLNDGNNNNQQNNNYNRNNNNGGYKKTYTSGNYNNRNNYNNYNNRGGYNQNQPNQQNASSYHING